MAVVRSSSWSEAPRSLRMTRRSRRSSGAELAADIRAVDVVSTGCAARTSTVARPHSCRVPGRGHRRRLSLEERWRRPSPAGNARRRLRQSVTMGASTAPRSSPRRPPSDRQVLDRQAGRVEERDLSSVSGGPPRRRSITSPISVTSSRVTNPAATAAASSPPALACSHSSQNRRQRAIASGSTSALPWASAPSTAMCWPGRRSARGRPARPPGSGDDHVLRRGLLAVAAPPAELVRQRLAGSARVGADARAVAGGRQTARRPGAVDAAADQPDRFAPRAPAPGPRPPRPPRSSARSPTAIDDRQLLARSRRRRASPAADHRQPWPVARERGDPLQHARPAPRAGIARKSPCGGLSR